jgi:hypothetical protein
MIPAKILLRVLLLLGGIALGACTALNPNPAGAQYVCPDDYYYVEGYGCAPLPYYYSEPTYIYPYSGFGFFYGGSGWGRRGYYYGHGGGFHGGGFHGGGFHGGGFHGGGFHGGGFHGGGFHGGGFHGGGFHGRGFHGGGGGHR